MAENAPLVLRSDAGERPKRILALDGGGVRGILTCAALERLEEALKQRLPESRRADFRLSNYFDLIGGTSTGSIIATWLALGHTARETTELYLRVAPKVFGGSQLLSTFYVEEKFDAKKFRRLINKEFRQFADNSAIPKDVVFRFDDSAIKTGLAIVAKRIDSGSPWIVHNNPNGRFWDRDSHLWKAYFDEDESRKNFTPNGRFELAKLVQASASAPFYLDPIDIQVGPNEQGLFLDGGISPHNNPALQLFLMTTMKWTEQDRPSWAPAALPSPYGYGWETGPDKLLLMSFGTGNFRQRYDTKSFKKGLAGLKAVRALQTMIADSSVNGHTWLQAISRSLRPSYINYEIGDMKGLSVSEDPLLSYLRVDAGLDLNSLKSLLGEDEFAAMAADFPNAGVEKLFESLHKMDNAKQTNLHRLQTIGEAAGRAFFDSNADDILF